jgi:hypothetical protein
MGDKDPSRSGNLPGLLRFVVMVEITAALVCLSAGLAAQPYRLDRWRTWVLDNSIPIALAGLVCLLAAISASIGIVVVAKRRRERIAGHLAATAWVAPPALLACVLICWGAPVGPHSVWSATNYCISNLARIHAAKEQWALDTQTKPGAIPTDSDLFSATLYLASKPECPGGGRYTTNPIRVAPVCSVAGHTLP